MSTQTVMWTSLPARRTEDGGLTLSVFVTPRLVPDGVGAPLADFPDFVDWPARRPAVRQVVFSSGQVFDDPVVRSEPPDSALWRALFTPTTPLEPFELRRVEAPLVSYPAKAVHDFVRTQWAALARSGPSLPDFGALLGIASTGPLRFGLLAAGWNAAAGDPEPRSLLDVARLRPGPVLDDITSGLSNEQRAFVDLVRFHQPLVGSDAASNARPLDVPRLDFHALVTILTSYPVLLRRLGLVLDVEVGVGRSRLSADVDVRVDCEWTPTEAPGLERTPDVTPWTAASTRNGRFAPRPADAATSDIGPGLVAVHDPERFEVMTVDVDGAGLKAVEFARTLQRMQARRTTDTATEAGLPALRSAGLALVRAGRATRFEAAQTVTEQHEEALQRRDDDPTHGIVLHADDVLKGLRVDVWDDRTQQWHSLCQRDGTYTVASLGLAVHELDEGTVTAAVATTTDPAGGDPHARLAESLLRWDGWSLAVRRPGAAVLPDGVGESAPAPAGLAVSFAPVSRSLPRLRHGRRYRLRARTVDLAGNSLSLEEADAALGPVDADGVVEHASEPVWFGRFEPLAHPVLVLRALPGRGESPDRLVVRTDPSAPRSVEPADRHVAPPQVAQLTAELHGAFDVVGPGARDALYASFVEGSLATPTTPDPLDGPLPPIGPPDPRKAALHARALHPEADLVVPYPPDPAAIGATLFIGGEHDLGFDLFEGRPAYDTLAEVRFGDPERWPEVQAFRLVVEPRPEGEAASVAFVGADRTLRVGLPQAGQAELRLSSHFVDEEALERMALWQWMLGPGEPPDHLARAEARQGKWWSLSPARRITVVHAVPRPLREPLLGLPPVAGHPGFLAERPAVGSTPVPGSTHVDISGFATVDAKSTVRLDLEATWDEWVDEPGRPPTTTGDPTSRQPAAAPVATFTVPLTSVRGTERSAIALDGTSHHFGDTRHRSVTYRVIATTRFAEYFDADAAGTRETPEELRPVRVIPSSARPAAPLVRAVVPSFEWQEEHEDGVVRRTRLGERLRVHLDRPWWSSGADERLAVLYRSGERFAQKPPALRGLVTEWGADPIRSGGSPDDVATRSHFGRAVAHVHGLRLAELDATAAGTESPTVTGAVHEVEWDPVRELWFCDVEVAPGPPPGAALDLTHDARPYFPFVRLALARYQAGSIPGQELSPVVLADFAPLAADRTASFSRDPLAPADVEITVTGPRAGRGNRLQAGIEIFDPKLAPALAAPLNDPSAAPPQDVAWLPVTDTFVDLVGAFSTISPDLSPNLGDGHGSGVISAMWQGAVVIPAHAPSQRVRVVVREYEPQRGDPLDVEGPAHGERLVYADAHELPTSTLLLR